jgi:hypothetical protein
MKPIQIAGLQAEIGTRDLSKTNQSAYHSAAKFFDTETVINITEKLV